MSVHIAAKPGDIAETILLPGIRSELNLLRKRT